jgi:hypothetical protein
LSGRERHIEVFVGDDNRGAPPVLERARQHVLQCVWIRAVGKAEIENTATVLAYCLRSSAI